MHQYIPSYRTNSYVDKMYCIYNNNCNKKSSKCKACGKIIYGEKTINAYTTTIPPKVNYSYANAYYPSNFPYVYYYGSYDNKLINYC
jgi:hypothetical protein